MRNREESSLDVNTAGSFRGSSSGPAAESDAAMAEHHIELSSYGHMTRKRSLVT